MKEQWKNLHSHVRDALPHAVLVLSLFLMTLFVTDRFNRAMAFLNNDISYVIIWIYALLSLWSCIETLLARHRLWLRLGTILPCLGALSLCVGRFLDELLRRNGFFNREASKWVLFGVSCLLALHAVLTVWQSRCEFRETMSNESQESE